MMMGAKTLLHPLGARALVGVVFWVVACSPPSTGTDPPSASLEETGPKRPVDPPKETSATGGRGATEHHGRHTELGRTAPTQAESWLEVLGVGQAALARVYGETWSPPAQVRDEEIKDRLCSLPEVVPLDKRRPTCEGPMPWLVSYTYRDITAYRLVAPREQAGLALSDFIWKSDDAVECPYSEHPVWWIDEVGIRLEVDWSARKPERVCFPAGCSPAESRDCECETMCGDLLDGRCTLLVDSESFQVTRVSGDCARPMMESDVWVPVPDEGSP